MYNINSCPRKLLSEVFEVSNITESSNISIFTKFGIRGLIGGQNWPLKDFWTRNLVLAETRGCENIDSGITFTIPSVLSKIAQYFIIVGIRCSNFISPKRSSEKGLKLTILEPTEGTQKEHSEWTFFGWVGYKKKGLENSFFEQAI